MPMLSKLIDLDDEDHSDSGGEVESEGMSSVPESDLQRPVSAFPHLFCQRGDRLYPW